MDEKRSEYDFFIEEYNKKHKCCPRCGSTIYLSTLLVLGLNIDKTGEYSDRRTCECIKCGDIHIYHNRISKK